MTNTLHRLDNPAWTSLKEDIDLRRREDIDRLHLLPGRPLQIHIRIKKLKRAEHFHKKGEDNLCRPLLHHHLHNQRMITVDTKE